MSTAIPRPGSGMLDGVTHVFPLRAYYEDTDAGGMVYHAAYLKYAERARTEMMRLAGLEHRSLVELDGVVFTVHSAELKYLQQVKLDDELVVLTTVAEVGGASMKMQQTLHRWSEGSAGAKVADIVIRLAVVNENAKPVRLPTRLRTALQRYIKEGVN